MSRLRLLLGLFREHAWSYLLGVILLAATLWMTVTIPRLLQQAIDLLSAAPALEPTQSGATLLDRLGWVLVLAIGIFVTRTVSRLCFFQPGRQVEYDLKNRLLAHVSGLQREFFLKNPTGSIISRINNDISGVRMMMGFGLMQAINAVATLSLAPVYMYRISPRLTLMCALPVALAFLLLQLGLRRMRRNQLDQMKALQDLSDYTVETYNGIDILKSYRVFPWTERKFRRLNDAVTEHVNRMSGVRAFFMPILNHIVNALKVLLVLVGGWLVIEGGMTMGEFTAYGLYLAMLLPPLMGMTFMVFVLQRGSTALISLEQIFGAEPGLPPVDPAAEARLPATLREGLRVQGLRFAYPDAPERPVLEGVSFEVRPGEVLGVFGPIGSGKTTLVNLLNRHLTPPAGMVFLDGEDVTRLGLHRLRRAVVTVTQEPFLFSDTVRENIRFAAPGDAEGAIRRAAETAALAPDLARFPQGLETVVGEKGITLSGGQKQRIALARAILKPCDLLILDDVLSAVDHETERFLIERIYRFEQARALLIVSHRISALERADRVLVLEGGRVTAIGTHAELVAQAGSYRSAWLLQTEQGHLAAAALPGAAGASPRAPAATMAPAAAGDVQERQP
ncbi:MAG: ABC transporter ATP-binding protein [Candidatus Lambdaproteobacteria bacterium]|nr:ABC transporter ATP-binding protein [Candidatus Lambdaproteobacteria bacterium]